jgi:hypothetical protein
MIFTFLIFLDSPFLPSLLLRLNVLWQGSPLISSFTVVCSELNKEEEKKIRGHSFIIEDIMPGTVVHACTMKLKQEDHEFQVSLLHIHLRVSQSLPPTLSKKIPASQVG